MTIAAAVAMRDDNVSLRSFYVLFGPFKPQFWWWETAECFRRLAVTGVTLLLPGNTLQIAFALLITILSCKIYAYYSPYLDPSDNNLQESCNAILGGVFLTLLIMHSDDSLSAGSSIYLSVLALGIIVLAINFTIYDVKNERAAVSDFGGEILRSHKILMKTMKSVHIWSEKHLSQIDTPDESQETIKTEPAPSDKHHTASTLYKVIPGPDDENIHQQPKEHGSSDSVVEAFGKKTEPAPSDKHHTAPTLYKVMPGPDDENIRQQPKEHGSSDSTAEAWPE